MVPQPDDAQNDAQTLTQANEETYDQLISLIENTQGRLAPIIVACDDEALRKRIIQRYESEAWEAQIRPYRLVLGREPSLRSGLETLTQQQPHLQRGGKAVFTVTGAELLLRVKLNPQDEQSELDKFFGYLQWTREGLREFRYPIVLWVTYRILLELSRRSADFWSWRKAVLRFETESPSVIQNAAGESSPSRSFEDNSDAEPLPPLAELQAEIAELTAKDPNTPALATLYDRLGKVYDQRISQGFADNLEQEREHTIAAFQQAITRYQAQNNRSAQIGAFRRLGKFFASQSRYFEAINCYQKSLKIACAIGDHNGEADSLNNLGTAYDSLGQYHQAIDLYQKSLEIRRDIGDRGGEADSLCNLGNAYCLLGQYQRAIDFYQQSLDFDRSSGNHYGESFSLRGLGSSYLSLKQYQRAISFHQQSLEIERKISNRYGEARSLRGLANAYDSLGKHEQAIDFYQQALEIDRKIGDRDGEADSFGGLGTVYYLLGQFQRAIEFYQQSLEIGRKIGARRREADSLFNIAIVLTKLGQPWEALQHYQQAKQIYQSLGLEHEVETCDAAIYRLNQIIPVQQAIRAPEITRSAISRSNRWSKRLWWVYGLVGLAIVLLIWWLKR